ncbi:MAG: lipid-A-disaccharide synthase [Sphingobacteriales bacterium]|jgi:lipid-A-disaccharide synthase|nr:lipid-A-disaccharide synthase [Sphingobacteriales bacterium]NCT75685.1 lipid-A-disaccharide synthase [Chitinophagaceae bacterium]OJW30789.1 MAG: lipid-A-disaccharide synthase [Sphingobacteriales bacterium 46-32]
MKYYIIAGEASGDLHGSNLIRELRLLDSAASIRCWGGDKMQEAGGELVKHYRDLAFMGFAEVVMNLRTIFRNLAFCKEDILQFKPDTLVLIDYPGFNLRIAKWARAQGIRVVYYISPQVWAWKENRVKMMKECIDKMLVILPFEKDYYRDKWSWEVEYVGHPLVEVVDQRIAAGTGQPLAGKPVIALLPGSRKQEIIKKLPVMLEVSRSFPDYQFIVAKAPGMDESFYDSMLQAYPNVTYTRNATYELLLQSTAALVTSGTATLETALFGVPEVVCYKGSPISYAIAKRVIKVKFISLVNLIMDRLVVKELIQHDLTPANINRELNDILRNETRKEQLTRDYAALKQLLSQGGRASAKAARSIYDFVTGAA